MSKVRVGIIGAGGIATIAHLPTLQAHQDRVEVIAIADISADAVAKVL